MSRRRLDRCNLASPSAGAIWEGSAVYARFGVGTLLPLSVHRLAGAIRVRTTSGPLIMIAPLSDKFYSNALNLAIVASVYFIYSPSHLKLVLCFNKIALVITLSARARNNVSCRADC